jgi:predicted amidohydrolase
MDTLVWSIQARAIENECYVAIAGCVGNLPKVNNMDIQYASAVYTRLICIPK